MQYSASTTPIYSPLCSPSHMSTDSPTLHSRADSEELLSSRSTSQVDTEFDSYALVNLIKLGSELKCSVCKDFYDIPMSSKCQHTFCAGCTKFDCNNKS